MTLLFESNAGTITVPNAVLVGIAVRAAETVEGVHVRRRRAVDLEANTVRLTIAASRGEPLVEVGERAQEEVASALKTMCGLDVTVDVMIGELR